MPSSSRTDSTLGKRARSRMPLVGIFGYLVPDSELHHMMAAQAFDQTRGRPLRDDLPVIHDGQPVAQPLRLIHIMRGQQNGSARCVEIRE